MVDEAFDEVTERNEQYNEYLQRREEILTEREKVLIPLINEYYDQCESNIDSYLDWHESPLTASNDNSIIEETLLNSDGNTDRESMKAQITELIEETRTATLAALESDHSQAEEA